jgi:ABC-type transport system involved in multi-copper enzyme maturation permease subunit
MESRAAPILLRYRPWRGTLRGPWHGTLAIARTSLFLLLRRKLFWGLYGVSAMIFMLFFYGQYLLSWLETQIKDEPIRLGTGLVGVTLKPVDVLPVLEKVLHLDGSGYTFRNFFNYEGQIIMIVLALAGSILVGNDFRFSSLPFYLSKPLHRWHYLGGKFLAVGFFINLMTTIPAIVLFFECGMVKTWSYYSDNIRILVGIIGYGALLTTCLGLLLLATASWLRRTMPMIMVWTALFIFARLLADLLLHVMRLDYRWRLIDIWNDLYLVGNWCLGMALTTVRPQPQPAVWEAASVLAVICFLCVVYLNRRIQAVEVA